MSQEFSFDTSSDDQILNYFKVADYFVSPLMEEAMNFKLAKMYSMGKNELEEMYGIKCEETYKKAQEEAYREYEDQMLAELYKIDPKFKDESIKLGRPFLC